MKKSRLVIVLAFMIFLQERINAQVAIVSMQLMAYNVTPDNMLSASIMNNGAEQQVQLVSKLYSFNNEVILSVRSAPFMLRNGLNSAYDVARRAASVEYSNGNQAQYIKATSSLPSGNFRICTDLILMSSPEPADQYCDEVVSDYNQYLYLVSPNDGDTVNSLTPLLMWTHSEPFSVLGQGESFRIVVSEMQAGQGPENAVTVNTPVMSQNYLTGHNIQYPYDAKELTPGKKYAWQIQKMANGVIINKTEAWEFVVRKKPEEKDIKYVALRPVVDGSIYTAVNGKVYFRFIEEYQAKGEMKAYIISDKGKELPVPVANDQEDKKHSTSIKNNGDNRFVLDLELSGLKPGYYRLEIKNAKRETFYLKIYLPG
ncbi:MAG: hypothetical protein JWO09_2748 [Bacteroidetes bacterium]|nr:hypothetical protein [Bacteroidota bacterium]